LKNKKELRYKPVVVMHICNPSFWEAEAGSRRISSSRPASAKQGDPVSKKNEGSCGEF
jgi:hypothetical protein